MELGVRFIRRFWGGVAGFYVVSEGHIAAICSASVFLGSVFFECRMVQLCFLHSITVIVKLRPWVRQLLLKFQAPVWLNSLQDSQHGVYTWRPLFLESSNIVALQELCKQDVGLTWRACSGILRILRDRNA